MKKTRLAGYLKVLTLMMSAVLFVMGSANANAQQGRLTFSLDSASFKEIINEIKKISDYDFVYSDEDIAGVPRRNVAFTNATVTEVLAECLSGTNLRSNVTGNTIVIRQAPQAPQGRRTLTGKVTANNGEPIIGASVTVAGTTIGTSSDADGNFTLSVPNGRVSIVVSLLGMESRTVTVEQNTSSVNVTLAEAASDIQALTVISTGIFQKARESYTGAVTEISSVELERYRGQNLIATLGNIDPAINIAYNNEMGSNPNYVPEITMRGNSSLPTSIEELNSGISSRLNQPLIVMNGFEISIQKLMDFNQDEIENITFLKDASSTAIYGSRGANGVIVINTKRPQSGKLRVRLQAGLNLEIPDLTSYNLLNAREKLEVELKSGLYEVENNPNREIKLKERYYEKLAEVERGVDTYWLSKPLRTGVGQRYNLRLDWGKDELQMAASLGYNNVAGVMKKSSRNNFSGAIEVAYRLGNLKFFNELLIDANNSSNSPYGEFSEYVKMNPYWRTHDENGSLIEKYKMVYENPYASNQRDREQWVHNPLMNASGNSRDISKYTTITNNFSVEWAIMEGLTLRGQIGISSNSATSDTFLSPSHTKFMTSQYQLQANYFRKGTYDYSSSKEFNVDANVTMSYSRTFAEKHQLYVGLDLSASNREYNQLLFQAEGFTSDKVAYMPNAMAYTKGTTPVGSEELVRRVGLTTNVNYTYSRRYYADLSYRLDGSSLFGNKNRFAPFWSAGIGWNVHNEAFMQDQEIISQLRLRASTGETGSQQFQSYQAIPTFKYYSDRRYGIWSGASLMGMGNPSLKWQTTMNNNAGIEFSLFNNRITASFDIYRKDTRDLLSAMDLQLSSGFPSYVENIGKVRNQGFEAMIGGYVIRNTEKKILLQLTGKIAYNKNTITKLSDAIVNQRDEKLKDNTEFANLLYEGHSVNSIYAVPSLGIDPSTGQEVFLDKDGKITNTWQSSARRLYGNKDPKYRGNMSAYFSYGNFSLNLSFAYFWGGQMYNQTLLSRGEISMQPQNVDGRITGIEYNADRRVLTERWYKAGDVAFFKGLSYLATKASSRFVMDHNVFELQNASVSYRWDSPALKKTGIDNMNFMLNMSNIFHWSSIEQERGLTYPFSRQMIMTVSLTF